MRLIRVLSLALGVLVGVFTRVAPAAPPDSSFFVDGLAVDTLEEDMAVTDDVFHGALPGLSVKKYIDVRRVRRQGSPFSSFRPGVTMSREASERMESAEAYIYAKEWGEALVEIQAALEAEPLNIYIIKRAATIAALNGDYEIAAPYFRSYLEAKPYDVDYLVAWAGVLIRLQKFDEAEAIVARALAIRPRDIAAQFNLVCIHIARDEYDEARAAWAPQGVRATEMVVSWLDADREDLVNALTPEGYRAVTTVVLGRDTSDQLPRIAHHLRQARVAAANKDWAHAASAYREVLDLGLDSAQLEMQVAIILFEGGDHENAVLVAEQLARSHPDDPAIWYDFGFVNIKSGRISDAIVAFERSHRLAPDKPQTTFALACAYAADGSMDKAWPLLEEVADQAGSMLPSLLEGNEPYLQAIRADNRYGQLMQRTQE